MKRLFKCLSKYLEFHSISWNAHTFPDYLPPAVPCVLPFAAASLQPNVTQQLTSSSWCWLVL